MVVHVLITYRTFCLQAVKMDWYSEPGKPYQTLKVNKRTGQLDLTATIPKSGGFLGTALATENQR